MKHTQVSSGKLSVRAIGNFVKWLYDRLSVVKDEGRDPTATSLMWFLDKSNHMSRRKDLKNVGGTLVMSFSPRNMVLTVSFKCRKLTSSNSAISFLKLKNNNIICQFYLVKRRLRGGEGVKNRRFWDDIVYGRPPTQTGAEYCWKPLGWRGTLHLHVFSLSWHH